MSMNTGNANIGISMDFAGRVAKNLWPAIKGRMDSEQMLGMSDGDIIDALRKGLCDSTAIGLVPLSQMDGVWMSKNASALFNGNLGTVYKAKVVDLEKAMNDFEIMEEYGNDIVFDSVDDLEATIADLVSEQPGGKSGKLLNNGYANIFYLRVNDQVRYVRVYWNSRDRGWLVRSDLIGSLQWFVGRRVFRNCGHLNT